MSSCNTNRVVSTASADLRSNSTTSSLRFSVSLRALALVIGVTFLFPSSLFAQQATVNQLKAAWVYNFCNRVQWNARAFPAAETPLVIYVLGDASMGAELSVVAFKKKVQGRQLIVKRVKAGGDYAKCHLLFVSDTIGAVERRKVLAQTRGKDVLVVGEILGFAEQGACVNLFMNAQRRVGFELNEAAASRQQLIFDRALRQHATILRGP